MKHMSKGSNKRVTFVTFAREKSAPLRSASERSAPDNRKMQQLRACAETSKSKENYKVVSKLSTSRKFVY